MNKRARIIVVGNEKGGCGKSTVAMNLLVALMDLGALVGSIDLDVRQATLSRYIENRQRRIERSGRPLPLPDHKVVRATADPAADEARFLAILDQMTGTHDVVVIDTPGSDQLLSRLGHSFADILVTPLNDSFIDLDVLGTVDPDSMKITRPSHYSEMVWEAKKARVLRGEKAMVDWVVLRNRLSHLDARNKRKMEGVLAELSRRVGFRQISGLGERVIYRELFLEGLTLLDLGKGAGVEMSLSHVAARQELRQLVDALGLARLVPVPTNAT